MNIKLSEIIASISGIGGLIVSIIALIRTILLENKVNNPNIEIKLDNILHETNPSLIFINNGKSLYVDKISFFTDKNNIITDITLKKRFLNDSDELIEIDVHDDAEPIMYHVWKDQCKEYIFARISLSNNKEIKVKVDVKGIYKLQSTRHTIQN